MPFDEFIHCIRDINDPEANKHFRSQKCFITNTKGALLVDYVGRLETFNQDMLHIIKRTGMPFRPIKHTNQSSHKPYKIYYSKKIRDIVQKRYKEDFNLLKYSFD